MIQDNETDRHTLVQQVLQLLEEPLPFPVADCDRLRAADGQFDDETGSQVDLCLHFSQKSSVLALKRQVQHEI